MSSASTKKHRDLAKTQGPLEVALVTVSDSRTPETDTNRLYLEAEIPKSGHRLGAYRLVPDDPAMVRQVLEELAGTSAHLILFNGGTGISRRDTTFDALGANLEKVLPGFGELFRMLSYQEIGPAAMLSRAVAGTYRGKLVISVPGSPSAVRLAWEKLIGEEMCHLAWEINR